MIQTAFSINRYDEDGDLDTRGIYLHFGEVGVRVADSVEDFKAWVDHLADMTNEISENYEANHSDRREFADCLQEKYLKHQATLDAMHGDKNS